MLDSVLSSPNKFAIIAQIVGAGGSLMFGDIDRERLGITTSAGLSFHITDLTDAGIIRKRRFVDGTKLLLDLEITDEGRRRFVNHCAALRSLELAAA
jgi:hypothetical protein